MAFFNIYMKLSFDFNFNFVGFNNRMPMAQIKLL